MNLEQLLYWKVWGLSICYALLEFTQRCKDNLYALNPDDFTKGWTILHRMKDNSDLEWIILTVAFKKYCLLIMLQVFCTQIIFRRRMHYLLIFYTFYSAACLMVMIGIPGTFFYLSYVVIMYFIHKWGRKSACYVLTVFAMPLLHNSIFLKVKDSLITQESPSFLFDVGFAWLLTKSLSFAIDRINSGLNRRTSFRDFTCVVAYCLYLPTIFTGPILSYDLFSSELYREITWKQFSTHLRRLLYITLWYFVYEFFLHFFYSSAIQFYPEIVATFDGWALCGLGYALPMMFYLKYFVIYGVAGGIASLEGFHFPPPPKCISCIHLSSFLWRHFDRGLYLWILKYLYHPLTNGKWNMSRKIFALLICFAFVCLWHGMDKAVTTWCVMNFFLVTSESVVQHTFTAKRFAKITAFQTRLKALCSMPHFMMMCLSCTFFLSNWDIGVLFMKRILLGGIKPFLPLACIMYCGCHVSMFSKQWQLKSC